MCNTEQLTFDNTECSTDKEQRINEKFELLEQKKELLKKSIDSVCEDIANEYNLKYFKFVVEKSVLGTGKKENHSHAVSVSMQNTFSLRVYLNNNYRIEIRDKIIPFISFPNGISPKKMKSYPDSMIVEFIQTDDIFIKTCHQILIAAMEHYEPSEYFGCCGKYIKCSNAKKCLHDEPIYSKACAYRKNLEAGMIFYGKNANI